MADTPFRFRLVTPQRLVVESEIVSLQAPGSEGYLGVLAHHAALITALRPGRLDVRDTRGVVTSYAVSGGFLEVSGNRASVLADTAERADEIDRDRARAARDRAEERLRLASGGGGGPGSMGSGGPAAGGGGSAAGSGPGGGTAVASGTDIDRERALRALERAKNRLAVAIAERG